MKHELIICSCQRHGRIKTGNMMGYEFLSKEYGRQAISSLVDLSPEDRNALLDSLNASNLPESSTFLGEEDEMAAALGLLLRAKNYLICPFLNLALYL